MIPPVDDLTEPQGIVLSMEDNRGGPRLILTLRRTFQDLSAEEAIVEIECDPVPLGSDGDFFHPVLEALDRVLLSAGAFLAEKP